MPVPRLIAVIILILSFSSIVEAATPPLISYQGRLTDAGGNPIPDGNKVSGTFSIYDAPSGGVALWSEVQEVEISHSGLFRVFLGSVVPLSESIFSGVDRYIGVKVGADLEMTPRERVVSSGYAFRTATVDGAKGGTITSKVTIGSTNTNNGLDAFVAGFSNLTGGNYATVSGGELNSATEQLSTVGGGAFNVAGSSSATVAGGYQNAALGLSSIVAGGYQDTASADYAAVAGGFRNFAGQYGFVGGGQRNRAAASYSVIPGGYQNRVLGAYSLAAGLNAAADFDRSFVWNGSLGSFASTAPSQFLINAENGVGIGTNSPRGMLTVAGGLDLNYSYSDFNNNAGGIRWMNGTDVNTAFGFMISGGLWFQGAGDGTNSVFGVLSPTGSAGTPGNPVFEVTSNQVNIPTGDVDVSTGNINVQTGYVYAVGGVISRGGATIYEGDVHVGSGNVKIPTGNLGLTSLSPSHVLEVKQNSATDPVADAWTTWSSRRWKENIRPISDPIEMVLRLRGVTFDWKEGGKHDIGLIAEEVGEVFPEIVVYEKNGKDAESLDYARLVSVLIEAVKVQQEHLNQQDKKIEKLESLVHSLISQETKNDRTLSDRQ